MVFPHHLRCRLSADIDVAAAHHQIRRPWQTIAGHARALFLCPLLLLAICWIPHVAVASTSNRTSNSSSVSACTSMSSSSTVAFSPTTTTTNSTSVSLMLSQSMSATIAPPPTPTYSYTVSPTISSHESPSVTITPPPTPTKTSSPSPSAALTSSVSRTVTPPPTPTKTSSPSPSVALTSSVSRTVTPPPTPTPTMSCSLTRDTTSTRSASRRTADATLTKSETTVTRPQTRSSTITTITCSSTASSSLTTITRPPTASPSHLASVTVGRSPSSTTSHTSVATRSVKTMSLLGNSTTHSWSPQATRTSSHSGTVSTSKGTIDVSATLSLSPTSSQRTWSNESTLSAATFSPGATLSASRSVSVSTQRSLSRTTTSSASASTSLQPSPTASLSLSSSTTKSLSFATLSHIVSVTFLSLSPSSSVTTPASRSRTLTNTLSPTVTASMVTNSQALSKSVTASNPRSLTPTTTRSVSPTETHTPSNTRSGGTRTTSPSLSASHSPSTSATPTTTSTVSVSARAMSSTQSMSVSAAWSHTITTSVSLSTSRSSTMSLSLSLTSSASGTSSRSRSVVTISAPQSLSVTWKASSTGYISFSRQLTKSRSLSLTASVSGQARSESSSISTTLSGPSRTASVTASLSPSETSSVTTTASDSYMTQTLSCPSTARVYILPVNLTDTTVDAGQRACALQSFAEALLTNRTKVICMPLYATAPTGVMEVLPATRGPPPPFLIAVRFHHDANWFLTIQGLTNISAVTLMDDPIDRRVAIQNMTNLSSMSGTLFILVEATMEWQSHIFIDVDVACGFNHEFVRFTVKWPQKQISTAQQVIVGLVSGGSTMSGNPTAASALAMVGLLSCSGSTPALQSAGYFVSLFFNLGPAAVAGGNLGMIVAILGLHYLIVRLWLRRCNGTITEEEAMADVRFPALSVFAAMYLLPGAVYGGVVSVSSGVDLPVGVVMLVLVATLMVASQWYLVTHVLPYAEYERYPIPHPSAFAVEKTLLLPTSRWVPEASERRFMPLMGTRVKGWVMLSVSDLLLAVCLSAATGLGVGTKGASCSIMPVVVATIYLSCAVVHIGLRPHRRPMDAVCFPISWSLFGTLCIFKYMTVPEELTDKMQLALSAFQLFQTAFAVLVFLRERQWRAHVRLIIGDKGEDRTGMMMMELDDPYGELWSLPNSSSSRSSSSSSDGFMALKANADGEVYLVREGSSGHAAVTPFRLPAPGVGVFTVSGPPLAAPSQPPLPPPPVPVLYYSTRGTVFDASNRSVSSDDGSSEGSSLRSGSGTSRVTVDNLADASHHHLHSLRTNRQYPVEAAAATIRMSPTIPISAAIHWGDWRSGGTPAAAHLVPPSAFVYAPSVSSPPLPSSAEALFSSSSQAVSSESAPAAHQYSNHLNISSNNHHYPAGSWQFLESATNNNLHNVASDYDDTESNDSTDSPLSDDVGRSGISGPFRFPRGRPQ